jgi:predicted RecB family nuclease
MRGPFNFEGGKMAFRASDFHFYYQLKPCSLRVYLRQQHVAEKEPDVYQHLLIRLGEFHEKRHLRSLGEYFDAGGSESKTRDAVYSKASVIYQPFMRSTSDTIGEIVGQPDFFLRVNDEYIIRDCKLSRRFSEEHHPEIFRQLELYGWLFERTFECKAAVLQVFMGDSTLREVPYAPENALRVAEEISNLRKLDAEPLDPVGWSKCLDCCFHEFCWTRAIGTKSVAVLPDVDQALARTLHGEGIESYEQLASQYDEAALGVLKKQVGTKLRKVGVAAKKILLQADSFISNKQILIQHPMLQEVPAVAIFDVEGIPPHLDYAEKTYLWGLKVFGNEVGPYMPANAGLGPEGDREGWLKFLKNCGEIFSRFGDIPFVVWSSYEKTQVRKYLDKFGDVDGIGNRLIGRLVDLLRVVNRSIVLPVPTYGLKTIERVAGYQRKETDTGGKWSMAKYIEAIETEDSEKAAALLGEIAAYNEEDLEALWTVYRWVLSLEFETLRT